jgi:hypothetical protein
MMTSSRCFASTGQIAGWQLPGIVAWPNVAANNKSRKRRKLMRAIALALAATIAAATPAAADYRGLPRRSTSGQVPAGRFAGKSERELLHYVGVHE